MSCSNCSDLDDGSTCESCAIILKFMTYGREHLRPDDASLSRVKKALHSVDRSDMKAVWDALLSAAPSMGNVPILSRDDETVLTTKELSSWENFEIDCPQEYDTGYTPPTLYLPGNEKINYYGPYMDANEWHYCCTIPIVDMVQMFTESNGEKVGFSCWPEVLSLLDKLCQSLQGSYLSNDNAMPPNGWFQNRIDRCVPKLNESTESNFQFADLDPFFIQYCTPHPFIRISADLIEMSPSKIFRSKENENLPLMWNESRKQLGDIALDWADILSQEGDIARAVMYVPSFVTVEQRLHLLVRAEHGYSLLHVPPDFDVWRQLISLSLYHPSTEQNGYLRAIQWEIMCEDEPKFVGPVPEMRALQFLTSTCQSLDGLVSIIDDYFVVKGKSSLYYSIKPSGRASNIGIEVRAYRNQEQTTSLANGARICIVFDDYSPLPTGDKIAAYMLTLCDDLGSSANISTLEMLHHTWFYSGHEHTEDGWKNMLKEFPHGFQEEEPDWEDEYFEEEEFEDHIIHGQELVDAQEEADNLLYEEWMNIVDNESELTEQQASNSEDSNTNDDWEIEAEVRGEAHCT